MSDIIVFNVAHRKREINFYQADNPSGFGANMYLFVHFISPAAVTINGMEHITDSGACIIYSPGQKQEYKHYNGIFVNDFLIFKVDDPLFLAGYGLPENEIFYITNSDEITRQIENITYTITDKLVDRRNETTQHVLKMFETLSSLYVENNPGPKRMFEARQRFIALRNEMRGNPKGWTVEKMAKQVWFTRSRFTVLYSSFFNISPNADLTNIRIEYAKKLLKTTNMPITDISASCGYSGAEHFIRIFNKKVKLTPLQYRKNNGIQ